MKMILNAHADHYLGDSWPMSPAGKVNLILSGCSSLKPFHCNADHPFLCGLVVPVYSVWERLQKSFSHIPTLRCICFYSVAKHSVCHILLNVAKVNSIENCCTVKTFCAFHLSWVLQIFPFPLELSCNTSRHFFFTTMMWTMFVDKAMALRTNPLPSSKSTKMLCSWIISHPPHPYLQHILGFNLWKLSMQLWRWEGQWSWKTLFDDHTSSLTAFPFSLFPRATTFILYPLILPFI